jgi:alkylation response protein AidB-like acyl-CoA dehydrogenase
LAPRDPATAISALRGLPVDGGYRVTGQWTWNTAGVHSNWFAAACVVPGEEESGLRLMMLR